ncbi:MAG: hypothetical protein ACJ766_08590 [Thermoleophilaceae bacterium]
MDPTVAVIVSPAAGLVGVGLGYLGGRRISTDERRAAARAERRRVVAAYLSALYPVVAELRALPDVHPGPLAQALDRLSGESATYVRSRREIVRMGSRPFDLSDRLAAATANLQVLELPAPLEAAVAKANAYVEQLGTRRSEALKEQWPQLWEELRAAIKSLPS